MQFPIFDLFHTTTDQIDVVLHGGSKGKDDKFMQKLVDSSKKAGNSVLAIDFPYISKNENPSKNLVDEVDSLVSSLEMVSLFNYNKIRFVTKSLGGIVASKFLNNLVLDKQKNIQSLFMVLLCLI
jgi:predicted alpha/beta-fold hydrolase